jgi:hypothetical protein
MTNLDIKRQIADIVGDDQDVLNTIIILEGNEFADGFIGLSTDNRAVCSYDKLVDSLSRSNNWSTDEAIDWLEYNTIRSLPYLGDKSPIIIHEPVEYAIE